MMMMVSIPAVVQSIIVSPTIIPVVCKHSVICILVEWPSITVTKSVIVPVVMVSGKSSSACAKQHECTH
jgi:hypothetical protein